MRLRLFSADDPSRQLDARMIGADAVTIGRDASADWTVADPARALSRKHCSVRAGEGAVFVRDTSANGTFVGDVGERIAPGGETRVPPGEAIRIGGYRLVVEAIAAGPVAPAPERPLAAPTPSMFAPPRGLDPVDAPGRPGRIDPFASQLAADPLLGHHASVTERSGLADHDAWDNRPASRAGDWEVPGGRGHENLIGTPRVWSEPPRPERDGGYGFDAPFGRPMLAPARAEPSDVAIPADWDAVPAAHAAAVPAVPERGAAIPPAPSPLAAPAPAPILPTPPVEAFAPAPVIATSRAEPFAPAPILGSPGAEPFALPITDVRAAAPASVPSIPTPVTASVPFAPAVPSVISPAPTAAPQIASDPLPAAAPPRAGANGDAMLFEAFCAGARLSPQAFAGEDRAAAMTRLGEVYRAMVLGLADLMGERTALKNEYRMTRTQVRAEGNNPFKWVPPQRLAIEVLRGGEGGFADGPQAVGEGFRDVKIHLLCMLAGMRAAIAATMEALSPAQTEAAHGSKAFLIKAQREAALWQEYAQRFERFRVDAEDSADGPINRAFRSAYEKQLGELLGAQAGYDGGPSPVRR